MEVLIVALMAGIIGGAVASGKGRPGFAWFVLCACFPFCVIIVLFLPRKREPQPQTVVQVVYAQPPPTGNLPVSPPQIDRL